MLKKNRVIICQKKHHPGEETENGMVSWSYPKSTCSADRYCRNHRDRTLSWAVFRTLWQGPHIWSICWLARAPTMMGRQISIWFQSLLPFINFHTRSIWKRLGLFPGWSHWVLINITEWQSCCFQLCPALVSKLASLANSNYLLAALKLCKPKLWFWKLNSGWNDRCHYLFQSQQGSLWWRRIYETPTDT